MEQQIKNLNEKIEALECEIRELPDKIIAKVIQGLRIVRDD